jgi:hypothetical protein
LIIGFDYIYGYLSLNENLILSGGDRKNMKKLLTCILVGTLLATGCIEVGEPEIRMEITNVEIMEIVEIGEWYVNRIDFTYENVGNGALLNPSFDFLLLKDGEVILSDRNLALLPAPIGVGEKGSLTGGLTGAIREPAQYTLQIEVREAGSAKISGYATKTILVGTRTPAAKKELTLRVEEEIKEWYQEWSLEKIIITADNTGDVTVMPVFDITLFKEGKVIFQRKDEIAILSPIRAGETRIGSAFLYETIREPGSYTLKVEARERGKMEVIGSATKTVTLR